MSAFSQAIENRDSMVTALEAAQAHGKAEGKAEAVKEIVAFIYKRRDAIPNDGSDGSRRRNTLLDLVEDIERGDHLNTGKEER